MKTILQKHTSKFAAGLLNGLGVVACVSLTACGNEKVKDKQAENLAGKIENILIGDEESLKKILEWLKKNDKNEKYEITYDDLDKIFPGSKSGVSMDNGKFVINELLYKLRYFSNAAFYKLSNDLKEKVARKYIDKNIDTSKNIVFFLTLKGYIWKVCKENEESVVLKVEDKGKFFLNEVDEESSKKSSDWLEKNGKNEKYEVTNEDFDKIFPGSHSNCSPKVVNEKQEKINKWLDTLKSFDNTEFNTLDDGLKEKVAQKYIYYDIDISNNVLIDQTLEGVIFGVYAEKEESMVVLKFEDKGKVSITNVVGGETKDFNLGEVEEFQNFVEFLKDKEITRIDGKWSLEFEGENIKICGHETGFKVVEIFENFVKCLETLNKVNGFKLPDLRLKINNDKLFINEVDCSSVYFYRSHDFWTVVKDNPTLFKIGGRFVFNKGNDGDNADGFAVFLKWNEVVDEDNEFIENSGWKNIFELAK